MYKRVSFVLLPNVMVINETLEISVWPNCGWCYLAKSIAYALLLWVSNEFV